LTARASKTCVSSPRPHPGRAETHGGHGGIAHARRQARLPVVARNQFILIQPTRQPILRQHALEFADARLVLAVVAEKNIKIRHGTVLKFAMAGIIWQAKPRAWRPGTASLPLQKLPARRLCRL
jgi:hypothetical protein